MGLECRDPSDPHEWLRRARSNFARAAAEPTDPEILLEDLCFDAQTRYPGVVESVTHEEWIEAVASANLVLRWAVAVIGPPGN